MKHYPKITRLNKIIDISSVFHEWDIIEISEKIDGSNASFCIDNSKEIGLSAFSRKKELDNTNTLNGFYTFVEKEIAPIKHLLNPDYIYFGEWLTPHKVKYKKEAYHKFYLFDIYDKAQEKFLPVHTRAIYLMQLKKELREIGIIFNEIIKSPASKFTYPENLNKDVEKCFKMSKIALEEPEGVVLKNYTRSYKDEPCYFKIVSEKYAEMSQKPKQKVKNKKFEFMQGICTYNRVEKQIYKLLDDNTISELDMDETNMGNLIKVILPIVKEDIIEEESDLLTDYKEKELNQYINKIAPRHIISFIRNKYYKEI